MSIHEGLNLRLDRIEYRCQCVRCGDCLWCPLRDPGFHDWAILRVLSDEKADKFRGGVAANFTVRFGALGNDGGDGVTVARGAIGNPWIFSQVRALAAGLPLPAPPSLHQQREVISEHYRLAEELYGAARCVPTMRKFGIKYWRLHPQHADVSENFATVREPGGWRTVLTKRFAEDLPGVHPEVEEPHPLATAGV